MSVIEKLDASSSAEKIVEMSATQTGRDAISLAALALEVWEDGQATRGEIGLPTQQASLILEQAVVLGEVASSRSANEVRSLLIEAAQNPN